MSEEVDHDTDESQTPPPVEQGFGSRPGSANPRLRKASSSFVVLSCQSWLSSRAALILEGVEPTRRRVNATGGILRQIYVLSCRTCGSVSSPHLSVDFVWVSLGGVWTGRRWLWHA